MRIGVKDVFKNVFKSGAIFTMCALSVFAIDKFNIVNVNATEADEVPSATTNPIIIDQGQIVFLNTTNINNFLEAAGYEYKSECSIIYYETTKSNNVIIDSNYITMVSEAGICDASTYQTLDIIYPSKEELDAMLTTEGRAALNEKYGKNVIIAEAAEGYRYIARFDNIGETTITIPHYELEYDGDYISVTIPVTIKAKTGWYEEDENWTYYENNEKVTGWKYLNKKWYYFNAEGIMSTGWKKISSKWYYFASSGAMQTGWQKLSDKWYYFNSTGKMMTGWQKLSDKWYYFNSSGKMMTGWQKLSGKYYYFTSSGIMQTGWKKISGKWYYFESNGVMVSNTTMTIDGISYTFNASGAMV